MPRKATDKIDSIKIVKNLPTSESGHGIHYKSGNGKEYCVSHCPDKERFTLWRIVSEGYEKMAIAKTPRELLPIADADK